MKSALSAQFNDGNIIVVNEIKLAEAKTKLVAQMLKALNADKRVLLVVPQEQKDVVRASKNLPKVKDAYVNTINVYDLLKADKIVVAKAAMQAIQEVYA
jgi:large subunit ribosomal protein L4